MHNVAGPRVEMILPLLETRRQLAGQGGALLGVVDHATYRDHWHFLRSGPDPWAQIATGDGIAINEQMARRGDIALGDVVTLADDMALPVVGIYGDYGNTSAQAIVAAPLFTALYPDYTPHRFGLRLARAEVPGLMGALEEAGLPAATMIDQAGIKAFSMQIFDRTFTVTGALNTLTLAVAGFAILMSLLTLAGRRVPQLAPVWALGLTRAQLGWLELVRTVFLAGLTAALALPLGLALAWVLLNVVNVAAFGWQLPVYLFWGAYARLFGLALLAAVLAALWPARRLARTKPARLLQVFANER